MALRLHPKMVGETIDSVKRGIEEGSPEWGPTTIRALKTHLSEMAQTNGGAVSGFDLDDVMSILIVSHWNTVGGEFNPGGYSEAIREILDDAELLEAIVRGGRGKDGDPGRAGCHRRAGCRGEKRGS